MAVRANCSLEASTNEESNISRLFSQVFYYMCSLLLFRIVLGELRLEEKHPQNQEYYRDFYQDYYPKRLPDFHIPEAVAIKVIYLSEDVHWFSISLQVAQGFPARRSLLDHLTPAR